MYEGHIIGVIGKHLNIVVNKVFWIFSSLITNHKCPMKNAGRHNSSSNFYELIMDWKTTHRFVLLHINANLNFEKKTILVLYMANCKVWCKTFFAKRKGFLPVCRCLGKSLGFISSLSFRCRRLLSLMTVRPFHDFIGGTSWGCLLDFCLFTIIE